MIRVWNTQDKSDWGQGPWQNEPDKAQWIDDDSNLDCLIVRNHSGALCGYVGVPESHPFYEKHYHDTDTLAAHGGITFADFCADDGDEARNICHTGQVANAKVWWFGFDCAHACDLSPKVLKDFPDLRPLFGHDVYRDFDYVKAECRKLAAQLKAVNRLN